MTRAPAELAAEAEHAPLPTGAGERFAGYGVMGLPLSSGHALAMRRFPASSIGPAYTAVWHRDRDGSWTFFQSEVAEQGCARYFSSAIRAVRQVEITVKWADDATLRIVIPEVGLDWTSCLVATRAARALNAMARVLPDAAWRSPKVLSVMSPVAGRLLGAGRVSMAGTAPNGQRFVANPQNLWIIEDASVSLEGEDLGTPRALAQQASVGEFLIPQRGIFAFGRAFFDGPRLRQ